jgi:hypothetical protein
VADLGSERFGAHLFRSAGTGLVSNADMASKVADRGFGRFFST